MFYSTFLKSKARTIVCTSLTILLAACGGGSGGAAQGDTQALENSSADVLNAGPPTLNPPQTAPPAASSASDAPFGQNSTGYILTFSDHFDTLNTDIWRDHQWYERPNPSINYKVENGALKIWPQRDATGQFFNRTLTTDGQYSQTYGYFEIEAKLPKGKGTWPAFWLFNHIDNRRPEIDIMEAYAGGAAPWGKLGADGIHVPTMYTATIWMDADKKGGSHKTAAPDLSAGFHKYALKWEADKQTFYFDGKEVYSANVEMSDPMYIMLDLWFGSDSGTPDDTTPTGTSNSYEINYVKAWKLD